MELKVLGSNSMGNAYILQNEQEALLIECGVHIDRIKQALGYKINKVAGCIISHSHKDHCKSVKQVQAASIDVYSSRETHEEMGTLLGHRTKILHNLVEQSIRNFKVLPFKVQHDTGMPFGFIIHHQECGNVLFLTDSYYSTSTFSNLNNIIVEANYDEEIMIEKLADKKFLRDRVYQSHMSIATCKELLRANDLTKVNNIVLIHLSDGNSHEERFKREVEEMTGATVTVADKGMTIPFNKTPY